MANHKLNHAAWLVRQWAEGSWSNDEFVKVWDEYIGWLSGASVLAAVRLNYAAGVSGR